MVWKLHPEFIIWCGGEFDQQPPLLTTKKDNEAMEEKLFVIPIQEYLKPLDPKFILNTDEKPCILAQINSNTIVFPDKTAPCFVPKQSREANCTLVVTTRGDGIVAAVTIILPNKGLRKYESEIMKLFDCRIEINITTSKNQEYLHPITKSQQMNSLFCGHHMKLI